jgi:hypothetical protein
VCRCPLGPNERRFLQALRVASERAFSFPSLSQQRSFPPQHFRQKRIEAVFPELGQGVVVKTLRFSSLLMLLRYPRHFDQLAGARYIFGFLHALRPGSGKVMTARLQFSESVHCHPEASM